MGNLKERLYGSVHSWTFRLFWPVFVEQLFAVTINLLATVMIRSVSGAAMAGVGLLTILNALLMNAFSSIASGVTVIVSQKIGAQDYTGAGKAAAHSLVLVFYISIAMGAVMAFFNSQILMFLFSGAEKDVLEAAGIFFMWSNISLPLLAVFSTIAGIMRATGNTRVPMVGSILSNAVYAAVAAVGIYAAGIGVHGSGLALAASRLAPALFLSVWLYRGRGGVYLPRLRPRPDMKTLRPVLRIAVPSGVDSIIFNGGKLLVTVFMSGMGTPILEANAIVNNTFNFVNLPGVTLQLISVTMVGQKYGAREYGEVKRQTFRLTGLCCLAELAACLIMLILMSPLMNMYNPSAETYAAAKAVMLLGLICTPFFWAPSFLTPQTLRATGDVTYTMWVSISSMIVLRVAGAWFFGVFLGMDLFGIWLSMIADWTGRGAFFMIRAATMEKRMEGRG